MSGRIYAASRRGLVPRTVNETDGTDVLTTTTVSFDIIGDSGVDHGTIRVCKGLFEAVDEDARRVRFEDDMRVASN